LAVVVLPQPEEMVVDPVSDRRFDVDEVDAGFDLKAGEPIDGCRQIRSVAGARATGCRSGRKQRA